MNPRIAAKRRTPSAHIESTESNAGKINVGTAERKASLWDGGALLVIGLRHGSLAGLALAAIGGGLIYRSITGHCRAYEALGYSSLDEADSKQGQEEHSLKDDEFRFANGRQPLAVADFPAAEFDR